MFDAAGFGGSVPGFADSHEFYFPLTIPASQQEVKTTQSLSAPPDIGALRSMVVDSAGVNRVSAKAR